MPAPAPIISVLPHRPSCFHNNTVTAGLVEDILSNSCPRVYQDAARPILRKFYDLAIKVSHVKHTLTNLEEHLAAGTFPTSILGALKPNKLQVTKEYTNSADHQEWESTVKNNLFASRIAALKCDIALKSQERRYLMSLISQDTIKEKMGAMISEMNASIASVHPGISVTLHPGPGETQTVDKPIHHEAARTIAEISVNMGLVAVHLGLEKHQKEITAQQKRIAKKKEADVAMQDADSSTIQETIRQEIKALLFEDRYRKKKPTGNKPKGKIPTKKPKQQPHKSATKGAISKAKGKGEKGKGNGRKKPMKK